MWLLWFHRLTKSLNSWKLVDLSQSLIKILKLKFVLTFFATLTKLRIDPSPQKTSGRLLISGKWSSIFVPCRAEGGRKIFPPKMLRLYTKSGIISVEFQPHCRGKTGYYQVRSFEFVPAVCSVFTPIHPYKGVVLRIPNQRQQCTHKHSEQSNNLPALQSAYHLWHFPSID